MTATKIILIPLAEYNAMVDRLKSLEKIARGSGDKIVVEQDIWYGATAGNRPIWNLYTRDEIISMLNTKIHELSFDMSELRYKEYKREQLERTKKEKKRFWW